MHSPETVAHEIRSPFKDKRGDRKSIITIWHHDPEKDGTDDSCGWFIRERHVNQEILDKIKKEFDFNYKHYYWFDEKGIAKFSTAGVLLNMYQTAAWIHFKRDRKKFNNFLRKHLHSILLFAENPTDCGGDNITGKFYLSTNSNLLSEDRFNGMAGMIYTDILRKERKWYQHPKWHIHHWNIQIHPLQKLKRRFWDKCSKCGKRGFKGSAYSDWGGKTVWHEHCDDTNKPNIVNAKT